MIYIFMGKGGVGKSTLACALFYFHFYTDKIKLFSADPMSNLHDILEATSEDVEELDVDSAVEKYLKNSVNEVKRAYSYLSALSMDSLVEPISFMPGIEEHVILREIERVIDESKDVIIDMPPAGLALRILALPAAEESWLSALIELRKKIVERRMALSKIAVTGAQEEDKVLERLKHMREKVSELKKKLQSGTVYVISTKDSLAELEAERIEKALKKFGFAYKRVHNMCDEGIPKFPFEPKGENLSLLEAKKWM